MGPNGTTSAVNKSDEVIEKPMKPQKTLNRRFCVAPMMDSESERQKPLCF
jgi:hypothetical protein